MARLLAPAFAGLLVAVGLIFSPAALAAAPTHNVTVYIVQPDTFDAKTWGFNPTSVTVPPGTTVTWRNMDGNEFHTVTSYDGLFDSPTINAGATWSFTFGTAGTFRYHCTPHPWMQGVVNVVAGAALPATTSPPPPPASSAAAQSASSPGAAPTMASMPGMGTTTAPVSAKPGVAAPTDSATGQGTSPSTTTTPQAVAPSAAGPVGASAPRFPLARLLLLVIAVVLVAAGVVALSRRRR